MRSSITSVFKPAFLLTITLAASPQFCQGQEAKEKGSDAPVPLKRPAELKFKHPSFTFVRIQYSGQTTTTWQTTTWKTDFPDADLKFSARFQKETGLKTDAAGKVLTLTNAELKRYPFIYIVEPGSLLLDAAEAAGLRNYLLGGGFLMADDFWGEKEWQQLAAQMKRVFPDREPVELSIDHPVFHCFYDIREKPQVPNVRTGIDSKSTGVTWERADAKEPHYRGLFDDHGRLMALFCHNTDLSDGWEHEGTDAYYFKEFSQKRAFPMGINIVVYALTQ